MVDWRADWYKTAYTIRAFEESLPALCQSGVISGTLHLSIGHEISAVSIASFLRKEDTVFSNHRSHAAFLAHTDSYEGLLRELIGDSGGVSQGIGGTQHLSVHRRFYSNGILGGMVPVATGYAASASADGHAVAVFLGDGALGQGVVYESFNFASLWRLPILYVVEDNGISQSTPKSNHLAGDIAGRLRAFGIMTDCVDCCNLSALQKGVAEAVAAVHLGDGPRALILDTVRLVGHSVNSSEQRDPVELARLAERDALPILRSQLDPSVADRIEAQARLRIDDLLQAPWLHASSEKC